MRRLVAAALIAASGLLQLAAAPPVEADPIALSGIATTSNPMPTPNQVGDGNMLVSVTNGPCAYDFKTLVLPTNTGIGLEIQGDSIMPVPDRYLGGAGMLLLGAKRGGSNCWIQVTFDFFNWTTRQRVPQYYITMSDDPLLADFRPGEVFMGQRLGDIKSRRGLTLVGYQVKVVRLDDIPSGFANGVSAGLSYDRRMCPGSRFAVGAYSSDSCGLPPAGWSATAGFANAITASNGAATTAGASPYLPNRYQAVVAEDQPAAWWPLNDSGASALPAAGTQTGSWIGTGKTTNVGAVAGDLDNTAADMTNCPRCYLKIPSLPTATLESNSTVELWFRTPTVGPDDSIELIGSGQIGAAYPPNWKVSFWGNPDGGNIHVDGRIGGFISNRIPNLKEGYWNHLVITRSDTTMTAYVNDVVVGSTAVSGYSPNGTELVLGEYVLQPLSDNGVSHFSGAIQHLAVYGYALSPAQIDEHYRAAFRAALDSDF